MTSTWWSLILTTTSSFSPASTPGVCLQCLRSPSHLRSLCCRSRRCGCWWSGCCWSCCCRSHCSSCSPWHQNLHWTDCCRGQETNTAVTQVPFQALHTLRLTYSDSGYHPQLADSRCWGEHTLQASQGYLERSDSVKSLPPWDFQPYLGV